MVGPLLIRSTSSSTRLVMMIMAYQQILTRHIPTRWECVMMIRECDTVIYNYDDDLGSSTGGGGRPRSRREDKKS